MLLLYLYQLILLEHFSLMVTLTAVQSYPFVPLLIWLKNSLTLPHQNHTPNTPKSLINFPSKPLSLFHHSPPDTPYFIVPLVTDLQSIFQFSEFKGQQRNSEYKQQWWHRKLCEIIRGELTMIQLQENKLLGDLGVAYMSGMNQTPSLTCRHALSLCLVSNTWHLSNFVRGWRISEFIMSWPIFLHFTYMEDSLSW